MLPVVHLRVHTLHIAVSTHAVVLVLAVCVGIAVAALRARAPGFVVAAGPPVAAGAIAGAWLLYGALHGPPAGGLASMGGIAGGILVAVLAGRVARRRLVLVLDDLAPGALAALGLGRIGCFLAGCCAGQPTTAPWGVVLPALGPEPRHPLQLYAAAFDLVLALWVARTVGPPGRVACRALVGLGLGRLALEALRDPVATDPILGGTTTVAQVGAVVLVLVGWVVGWRRVDRSRPRRYLFASSRAR